MATKKPTKIERIDLDDVAVTDITIDTSPENYYPPIAATEHVSLNQPPLFLSETKEFLPWMATIITTVFLSVIVGATIFCLGVVIGR